MCDCLSKNISLAHPVVKLTDYIMSILECYTVINLEAGFCSVSQLDIVWDAYFSVAVFN